ncbi:nitronate monooxygenase family protein [Kutzneria buriramensis]|uniref:Nitronate monooxygenase n=1 Tax=Kutzneria buriramensis TaxID=1045776 RepID=A0A3E0I6V2_9PSEU|nr:nitronate monooxygenase [Kutzneria buriramensis]REH54350.1 nitronate monooxygenase [Kutzneria buriramensis]
MSLPAAIIDRLRLPLIAAPMLRVSGPELVTAACTAGVIGAFPTANARTAAELDDWLSRIEGTTGAPYAANLIIRSPRLAADLRVLVEHRVELVITSVGSPAPVIDPLHEVGALVLADVATLHHAERAVAAGADGLILLTAGAGGQTGWLNPFAFVRAVRAFFDGPVVLAGGISDGHALHAARALGCDLAYMGTKFLATRESRADPAYKRMVAEADLDDIVLTRAFTGLPTSMLAPAIRAAGLDPAALDESISPADADQLYGHGGIGPRRWSDVWSAGHSVSGVTAAPSVAELVEQTATEFAEARKGFS